MRDDFLSATKIQLAARAGHRCAFPGCPNVTTGPSSESETAVSNTGMACHISSASGGKNARRYDPNMTTEQRKSINNGIWMCFKHGKIIDTDEKEYSTSVLRQWKELSEKKAQLRHALGEDIVISSDMLRYIGLGSETVCIEGVGEENYQIGNVLKNARVDELWGKKVLYAIQDLSIEFSRNAFQHGGATKFRIKVNLNSIELFDDGSEFNVWDLYNRENASGGTAAARNILGCTQHRLVVVSKRVEQENHTLITILDSPSEFTNLTECSVDVNWNELRRGNMSFQVHEDCRSKCVVLPPFVSISDAVLIKRKFPIEDGKPIIFILRETSPESIAELESYFPGCLTISCEE